MHMTFVVEGITRHGPKTDPETEELTPGDIHTVTLVPTEKNVEHWNDVPSGKITLMYLRPESSEGFAIGDEYELEIKKRA